MVLSGEGRAIMVRTMGLGGKSGAYAVLSLLMILEEVMHSPDSGPSL